MASELKQFAIISLNNSFISIIIYADSNGKKLSLSFTKINFLSSGKINEYWLHLLI